VHTGRLPHWDRGARLLVLLVVAAVCAALLGACAGADREPRTIEIVVPAGTQQRLDAGERVEIMPARLELRVGDTLLIRNEDGVAQSVGPFSVPANGMTSLTYGAPGRFEGYCPLSEGQRYEIVVDG
jgi:hypothetical protein